VINDNHMLVTICFEADFYLGYCHEIEWNETPQFELMGSIWSKAARLRTLLVPSVEKEMKDTWIASL
jgi:hypothetical protein